MDRSYKPQGYSSLSPYTTSTDLSTPVRRGMTAQVTSRPAAAQHLRDLARLQASGAEVVQEPTEQPYSVRDCAFRDPTGNLIRIQELR